MRPEHWLFTIPLRLRSLFRWAQADQTGNGIGDCSRGPVTSDAGYLMQC